MDGTIEQEFKITFKTDLGNIYSTNLDRELEVETYLDRVEECYGFHEMYEVSDSEIERAIDDFIDDYDEVILLELCSENDCIDWVNDDEKAIEILKVEAA